MGSKIGSLQAQMEKHQFQIYEKTTKLDKITAELSLAQAEAEQFA